jgi:shikimate dehydrogenase
MNNHTALTSSTKIVGLIGWPVSHSVSPLMHNAAFAALGLDWRYVPLPVDPQRPDAVRRAVQGLAALGMAGANVTVPHKQAVMPLVDHLLPAAQAIGAVNTLVVQPDGSLAGDNTDAAGFIRDLRAHGVEVAGRRVLLLGAGGSARAVAYGLAAAGVRRIDVLNRTQQAAQALVAALQPLAPDCPFHAGALPQDVGRLADDADLIVNCTPLGMMPRDDTTPWPQEIPLRGGQVVYDLVYNPPQTLLLREAAAAGAQAIGGLGMLVWQGALAFERWTGHAAPVDIMRGAAETHFAAAQQRRSAAAAMPDLCVRIATLADCAAISELNGHVQRLHALAQPDFFKLPSATTFPPDYVAELMARRDTVMLVAEVDRTVVGYLYADVTPAMETSSTFAFDRFYIHHIGVTPQQQGKGVGAALIEAAQQEARTRGIGRLALSTWAFNQQAQRFFEGQGFEYYNHRMWMQNA